MHQQTTLEALVHARYAHWVIYHSIGPTRGRQADPGHLAVKGGRWSSVFDLLKDSCYNLSHDILMSVATRFHCDSARGFWPIGSAKLNADRV